MCAKTDVVDKSLTPIGMFSGAEGVRKLTDDETNVESSVSKINDNIQKMQKSLYKEITITTENTDSVVFSIIEKIKSRADVGMEKYKTNLDRQDLSTVDWIIHAQEELMDAILYLEKLKQIKKVESKNPAFMITNDTKPSAPPSYIYDTSDDYFSFFSESTPSILGKESRKRSSASPDQKIFDFQERRCKVEGLSGPPTEPLHGSARFTPNFVGNIISTTMEPTLEPKKEPTAPLLDISNISVNFIDVVE